jgi:hypothetical protein
MRYLIALVVFAFLWKGIIEVYTWYDTQGQPHAAYSAIV